jgi:tetratricopeptide (TPR) repeat protein
MALRFCVTLREFWEVRGLYSEGRAFLEQALANSEGASSSARASALGAAAEVADLLGDFHREEELLLEALGLYRELGDTRGIAWSLSGPAGLLRVKEINIAAAISMLEESVTLLRELGDKEALAWSLFTLADTLSPRGEFGRGLALFEESLALFRELGNKRGIAANLQQSALHLILAGGDQAIVEARLKEMLALDTELGDKNGIAYYYWISGWVAFSQRDMVTAYTLMEQSLALWQEIGARWLEFWAIANLGRIKAYQGDVTTALAFYEQSLALAREFHDDWLYASCLEWWASVVAAQGKCAWAAHLWGAAETSRESCGLPLTPLERVDYEPAVAAARNQLGEQAFATAWAEGRAMTFEQALSASE